MKENLALQINKLEQLEQQLQALLDEQQYEMFQQKQALLSTKIRELFENNSPEILNTAVNELKKIEKNTERLTKRAENTFKQLKEKSLLQKRNKNRVNAYK